MPLLAVVGWLAAWASLKRPWWLVPFAAGWLGCWIVLRRRRRRTVGVLVGCLLVGSATAAVADLRLAALHAGPLDDLARAGRYAELDGTVSSDPVVRKGRFSAYSVTRVLVTSALVDGRTYQLRSPVLVIADERWSVVPLGARISFGGRLKTAPGPDEAAVVTTHRSPRVRAPPAAVMDAAAAVRAEIRSAVGRAGPDERALVPALVVGDDKAMSAQVVDDFRTTGLTHLAAVSGTNLTLVVGFLLVVARWTGVRARGLTLVGLLGVAGFVVLARPEPSVLRAAAMGSVALLGMGAQGPTRGARTLGTAVLALLLLDPWLSFSVGFALSTLATAGILFLAPPARDALGRWLPRWLAEAVAVPFAAQLACTPLIAGISGRVSLVAVLANLAVAPAVGPATVLGLVGGLLMFVSPALGLLVGRLAGLAASWIILVATHLARLPVAAVDWSATPLALATLALLCAVVAVAAAPVLSHPALSVSLCVALAVVLLVPVPTPDWPPRGWVLVACDVGQGDGLVLDAGHGLDVVVDTGPDPALMAACLRRLHVHRCPVVVLTHFHADHVAGLPAVLGRCRVGEIDVTALRIPREGALDVYREAAAAHVPVRVPAYGEVRRVGDLTWQVIAPAPGMPGTHGGEEGTVANNSSLVMLVRVHGISILMGGDMEPEAQAAMHEAIPALRVDVLKVPHHGSAYQDPDLLTTLHARLAVISVGLDNDYGHPAASTITMLRSAGLQVRRTDLDGDVAVVVRQGRLAVATRH
jgi:competence protein ComEC